MLMLGQSLWGEGDKGKQFIESKGETQILKWYFLTQWQDLDVGITKLVGLNELFFFPSQVSDVTVIVGKYKFFIIIYIYICKWIYIYVFLQGQFTSYGVLKKMGWREIFLWFGHIFAW